MSPRAAWRLEDLGFKNVYEYANGLADWAASGLPTEGTLAKVPTIGEVSRKDVPVAGLQERLEEVKARVETDGWNTAIVVNDEKVVLGRLYKSQLDSDPEATVESIMKPGPSTFRPNVSAPEMTEFMKQHDLDTAPVTTSEGVLIGVVLKEDLDKALEEVRDSHHHDHG
ncbi:MAG: CBS domain-containing protein [Actinobacteria bacterium]|nr:CBS domain-containing protein [Actinomycetota bacterium]